MNGKTSPFVVAFLLVSSWIIFAIIAILVLLSKRFVFHAVAAPTSIDKLSITTLALVVGVLAYMGALKLMRHLLYGERRNGLAESERTLAALRNNSNAPSQLARSHSKSRFAIQDECRLLLDRIRAVADIDLRTDATEAMGRIMESFKASSANLWLLDSEGKSLERFVALNTARSVSKLPLQSKGIIPVVANTGQGYCSNDVSKDPNYVEIHDGTKSEIAVPIKSGTRVIGVLNLESTLKTHNFLHEQIPDLEKMALRLAPLLLTFESFGGHGLNSLPWYFDRHEWGISRILGPLVSQVCSSLHHRYNTRPSCTIWEFDADKQTFHVRATSGFDYEYRTARSLPFQSFTGKVYQGPVGKVLIEPYEKIKQWFIRGDKAEAMGLKYVMSAPIQFQSGKKYGVLSFYFFDEVQGLDPLETLDLIDLIGSLIEKFTAVVPAVAEAYVRGEIVNAPFPSHGKFEVLRRLIQQIMKSEYCSIFVKAPDENKLRCASTTGLEKAGKRVYGPEAVYDLDQIKTGFTALVAAQPGTAVRKNESQDEKEPVIDGATVMPSNHLAEAFAFGDSDHRRLLIASIGDAGKLLWVFRLNRPGTRAPFIKSDEAILLAIGRGALPIFQISNAPATPSMGTQMERVKVFCEVLALLPYEETTTTGIFVDEIFNHFLPVFHPPQPEGAPLNYHLLLRRVVRGKDDDTLDTKYNASTRGIRLSQLKSIPKSQGGIGWRAIKERTPVSFHKTEAAAVFQESHEWASKVVTGINVPFRIWDSSEFVYDDWVLCLDYEFEVKATKEYMSLLFQVVRRFQQLLTKPRGAIREQEGMKSFFTSLKRNLREIPQPYNTMRVEFQTPNGRSLLVDPPGGHETDPSHPRLNVPLEIAFIEAGSVSIELPADSSSTGLVASSVLETWKSSGASIASGSWVIALKEPRREDGLTFWPADASWVGSTSNHEN